MSVECIYRPVASHSQIPRERELKSASVTTCPSWSPSLIQISWQPWQRRTSPKRLLISSFVLSFLPPTPYFPPTPRSKKERKEKPSFVRPECDSIRTYLSLCFSSPERNWKLIQVLPHWTWLYFSSHLTSRSVFISTAVSCCSHS